VATLKVTTTSDSVQRIAGVSPDDVLIDVITPIRPPGLTHECDHDP
jgi:hypothetical protein